MPTASPLLDLTGVRIWLSASIPDELSDAERERLLSFVRRLSAEVFKYNGTLIHGSHPSIVPTLLAEADGFQRRTGRKANLTLLVSAFFSKDPAANGIDPDTWGLAADVVKIAEGSDWDQSLARLRDGLAARADVLVAAGGRWWQESPLHAGVPQELRLARQRGIASFLLGGLGGAMRDYWRGRPELLRDLKNGLDDAANEQLATMNDVDGLVARVLGQVSRLPLKRPEARDGQPFRILALDGGGIRGTYTAAVLAHWERVTGRDLAGHFDLIAGTSTGGILALGLGMGLTAAELLDFYRRDGPTIFPLTSLARRKIYGFRQLLQPKFNETVLRTSLQTCFQNAPRGGRLGKSTCRLAIPCYDVTSDSVVVFRTSHSSHVVSHDPLSVVEAALATAAAPTYFNPAHIQNPVAPFRAVDGGVWANCPVMVALSEAVGVLGVPLDRIDLLSVGTTYAPFMQGSPFAQGMVGWASKIVGLLMKTQSQATLHHARQMLGSRLLRVDSPAPDAAMDDPRTIDRLAKSGERDAEQCRSEIAGRFLNGVQVSPWQ